MLSVTNKPLMLSGIKLNVVVLSVVAPHLYPSLTFAGKAGLTQVESLIELHSMGRPLALPANVRLELE